MAEVIQWRSPRPYIVHELEPGRAPEAPSKPWLYPEQMELARKVLANDQLRQKKLDLKGERYGRLKVLRRASRGKWMCRCDCGKTKEVKQKPLRRGNTRSCGCLKKQSAQRQARLIWPLAMAAIRAKSARARARKPA